MNESRIHGLPLMTSKSMTSVRLEYYNQITDWCLSHCFVSKIMNETLLWRDHHHHELRSSALSSAVCLTKDQWHWVGCDLLYVCPCAIINGVFSETISPRFEREISNLNYIRTLPRVIFRPPPRTASFTNDTVFVRQWEIQVRISHRVYLLGGYRSKDRVGLLSVPTSQETTKNL